MAHKMLWLKKFAAIFKLCDFITLQVKAFVLKSVLTVKITATYGRTNDNRRTAKTYPSRLSVEGRLHGIYLRLQLPLSFLSQRRARGRHARNDLYRERDTFFP